MCRNKPLYSGPTKRVEAHKNSKFTLCNLQYLVREDHIWKNNLQDHVDTIMKNNILVNREL